MKKRSKREEEYLEALYILARKKKSIRIKNLAKMLKIKPSSVTEYLDKLSKKGLVHYEKHEVVMLTEEGVKIAEQIYKKHTTLKKFLILLLKIPENIAEKEACYIEHGIHEITFTRVTKFVEFVTKYPSGIPDFLKQLEYYYEHNTYPEVKM
ncbi:MAG: metal-dependent transcriptional regulator [Candidatus Asgardarchaeia archaeon]